MLTTIFGVIIDFFSGKGSLAICGWLNWRAVGAEGPGVVALQILADQLTLSQPEGGGRIMPTKLLLTPRIFWPSYTWDWKFVKITATALKTSKSAKRCL